MKNKNILKFLIFYLIVFIAISMPYSYIQTFLEHVGYDVVERGIILSGAAIVTIVTQFGIGYICDKYKTDKKPFNVTLIILVISALIMYQITHKNFFMHLIFASLVGGLSGAVMSVQDAWTLEVDKSCKENYGTIRAFGAIGWMIGTPIGAFLIEKYGYTAIGPVFAALSILSVLYTIILEDAQKQETTEQIKLSDLKQLFKSKRYIVVVTIFFFIFIISSANLYTVIDKLLALNARETVVGMRGSIQAFVELPLFFAGAYLLKRFGDRKLLIFGTIMYIIRFIGYAVVQTPELILLVTCMQCVTFPIIMITSKTLVDSATPENLKTSGQTIASSIYSGIPALITPLISGFLIQRTSIDFTLLFYGIIGLIPLGLGLMLNKIK